MQISGLFDEYWIHERLLETQPRSLMMLLKTLVKLFEHIIQHRFRSITCYAASNALSLEEFLHGDDGSSSASVLCAHIGSQADMRNCPAPSCSRSGAPF
jgi:hypothetical protein